MQGIVTETTYFVPLGQKFEYWRLKVTNEADRPRQLSVFTFCEFTNQWITSQDQVNLQYSLFIVRGEHDRWTAAHRHPGQSARRMMQAIDLSDTPIQMLDGDWPVRR